MQKRHSIECRFAFLNQLNSLESLLFNFLSFSDKKWNLIAGNKYMYANRMRHDDFIMLFEEVGHKILLNEPLIDQNIQKLLNSDTILLNEKFSQKSIEILSTTGAWIGTRKINRHKP